MLTSPFESEPGVSFNSQAYQEPALLFSVPKTESEHIVTFVLGSKLPLFHMISYYFHIVGDGRYCGSEPPGCSSVYLLGVKGTSANLSHAMDQL